MDVYENGRKIGSLQLLDDGLYYRIECALMPTKELRRIYLAYPYGSMYLGLADRDGRYMTRLAKKRMPEQPLAVCSCRPKGAYAPWRGEVGGNVLDDALIGESEILILPQETVRFPQWVLETKKIDETEMVAIPLNDEGLPQPREREATNDETMDIDDFDIDLLADVPADDGFGSEGWQADRADL